ncbi:putative Mg2+ transporter-C (MgtC) family protein [Paenibacillus sp. UNCCL117]|uniref:MgtC/SapB family protein n=1 Tax=unclassified Paenibacillus TaxID=185978 RepID=UPI00088046AC|nr:MULTISPECIES: MgtC/SapB family protein [unclassified Paenibacillus]SDE40036.1 putative Mg2+ transporter-C (MgtC) family protein [Paenibacillus sp. cl123]SFW65285.1 putative Mg2+ transporter-C (MgtC) family protein [Paenibacillus sp. UNCCL117]
MNDPWSIDLFHITLRLLLSMLLGGLIGFEREQSSRAAGLRTHMLVCLGSTLIMLLSMYGFSEFTKLANVQRDPARLAAQVISGIGFLGAGTILYTGKAITGLTTAASLWVVAAIGLAIGAGFYYAAGLACLLALISLFGLHVVEKRYMAHKKTRSLRIEAADIPSLLGRVSHLLAGKGCDIKKWSVEEIPGDGGDIRMMQITLDLRLTKKTHAAQTIEELLGIEGIRAVSMD